MTQESLLENLSIHNANLSLYYLGSVFVTLLCVVIAWWYHKQYICQENNEQNINDKSTDLICSQPLIGELDKRDDDDCEMADNYNEVFSKLKMGRQSLIADEIASTLTEEQLIEEREVEKKQLEAIFQLLQNQEDKFQVSSLEELEDQLKLYRF